MKRMELQSFYLKLNELKEYDHAKAERGERIPKDEATNPQTSAEKPLTKGPKTKQEIQTRIGLNLNSLT
ncbi:CLUMA_CG003483, isoform A [Clunio marinus]|uniref:CLUMA_CG003483, isoform A n=1 Tax=Clunio marinus TaxID=568069 RepID=A0A1J1HNQ7_9DIPT|nr:CLUMA_CG003483, isoform A [Clunio marinus]